MSFDAELHARLALGQLTLGSSRQEILDVLVAELLDAYDAGRDEGYAAAFDAGRTWATTGMPS